MLQLQTPYPKDTSFTSLEHLELCTCSAGWTNLLACILNDAPKLRSLELKSVSRCNFYLFILGLTSMFRLNSIITDILE